MGVLHVVLLEYRNMEDPQMAGVELPSIVIFLVLLPALYGIVGRWLSELGPCEGAWDQFFNTWPFSSIGALIGAVGMFDIIS